MPVSSVKVDLTHDQGNSQFSLKIDGREVRGVRSYEIKASVDELPTITLTLITEELVVNGVYHPAYNTLDGTSEFVQAAIAQHAEEKAAAKASRPVDPV